LMIAPGWEVLGRSGGRLGVVTAVVGDEDADIFDGLRFESPDGEQRFVTAARVSEIVEGRVTLTADLAELERSSAAPPAGMEVRRDREAEL